MTEEHDPFIPRDTAAALISERVFAVKERELRRWSEVPLTYIMGRAMARRSSWLAAAESRLHALTGAVPDKAEHAPP